MVKVLNREIGNRMWGGKSNVYGVSGGGTGGGDVDLSSYATMAWTKQNFVSIEYFRTLFKAFDSNDDEIVPNDTTSVVNNIKAMVGLWTEQYLTALGNQSGGGGGGGGAQYLNDLLDVQLTTPLTDGQALVYNATLQKWVNGAAGVNMTTVWNALAGSTNEQINASHLSTALSGYVTTSDISDMATQTWVGQQGFATQTWVTSNFITIAYFDRLFRAYNGSTLVSHNDTTSTIDNIKAMFGFWTDFYLSALGTGGVSSVSISLSQLADVNVAGVTNNQFLGYDSTNAEWVNTSLKTINGNSIIGIGDLTIAGVSTLSGLTDVLLTSLAASQVLIWDSASSKWVNTSLKTINYQSIIGSGDISVGGGASGNYLPLTGGHLQNGLDGWIFSAYTYYSNTFASAYIAHGEGYGMYIGTSTYNQGHYIAAFVRGNTGAGTGGSNVLLIDDYGRVGINKNPEYDLDVFGYSKSLLMFFKSRAGGNAGYIGRGSDATDEIQVSSYVGDVKIESANSAAYIAVTSSGNIGINTRTPNYPLHVYNSRQMWSSLFETPYSGVFLSHYEGAGIYVGSRYNSNSVYLLHLVANETSVGGGGYTRFIVLTNGATGICTSSPQYELHVNGNAYATGAVTALSDIRHKTIIKDAAVSVEDIARMPAVMYQWNDGRDDKELHVGSIAQNWQTVLPEVVLKANDKEGTLSMQYGVAALVSSIIIARKVVNHEDRIKQLEKENKELKERLNIA